MLASKQAGRVVGMRITVGMLKGGASRTTTAVLLALALEQAGSRVLLVDADPANGTAFEWAEDAAGWPVGVEVVYWPISGLGRRVEAAAGGFDAVVIDTGNDAAALQAALSVSDQLVVPIAPTGTESTRLTPTLEAAAQVARTRPIELSLLLSRVRHTRSRTEVRTALAEALALRVLETEVPLLERFASAYGTVPADLSPFDQVAAELATLTPSASKQASTR